MRQKNDAYNTPADLALAICARLQRRGINPGVVVEPSAGQCAFVIAARHTWPETHVIANEINPDSEQALNQAEAHQVRIGDFMEWSFARVVPFYNYLVLGNPPYTAAADHVQWALDHIIDGDRVAFLLRMSFLASRERVELFARPGLESVAPIIPRPSFTGDGKTDGAEYLLYVWRKGYTGQPVIDNPIIWRDKICRAAK